ncbi:MAG: hypothetical protein O9276_21705 [Microcystis sp. LE17-20A]|jgi:hypothetical protein|uniref:hypothetical protein n=1 Tax=unclassified Microcystis TaxID=2643300 RepID=UPI0022BFEB72|nr:MULTISPECIES: hypothetical protein [unclassified Microcystis]MCZ8040642.1 hypothetical protein [Microcystis sp. LE17-20A]MCZ8211450.1 hypothetical protein [Microcystis sp. LE19-8.1F]
MDPLTGAAIAVGSIIATKALEKTGEKVGEKVWQQTEKFGSSLLFMLNQQTRCQDNILLTQKFRKFLKP